MLNIIVFSVLFSVGSQVIAQEQPSGYNAFNGVAAEYNTLIVTHNLKIFSDFTFYRKEKINAGLQPGIELIYSFPGAERTFYNGSPFYDINVLGIIQLFPDYGISIVPFIGLSYRIPAQKYNDDFSLFNVKYGGTIQLNLSKEFKIIGKIMNVPQNTPDDIPFLAGVGFSFIF